MSDGLQTLTDHREQGTRTPVGREPELLIEEARMVGRRRRRRSMAGALAVLALVLLAVGIARVRVGGSTSVDQAPPAGVFVNAKAFSGHGVLAFVSRGRLFVLDGVTGILTAVTRPGSTASAPVFSPNGDWLAYTLGTGTAGVASATGAQPSVVGVGAPQWLPDGDLLVGTVLYRIAPGGRPVRDGSAPAGLVAWSRDGDRFAFVTRTVRRGRGGSFHGVERLQVAETLTGRRTTWLSHPISFTHSSGFVGYAINGVQVLPAKRGLVYAVDPMQSASLAADGTTIYQLRASAAKPAELGVSVGQRISVGAGGKLALGGGGNRYAWITKTVETCTSRGRCTAVHVPTGKLSIDPAWSPDGRTLAFVEAAAEPTFSTFTQPMLTRWYTTHTLSLLRTGRTRPTTVAGTEGASTPSWSADGKSLLYVANDGLWLIPALGATPERVAAPLFPPNGWPSYYGQIDWADQFAWSSATK